MLARVLARCCRSGLKPSVFSDMLYWVATTMNFWFSRMCGRTPRCKPAGKKIWFSMRLRSCVRPLNAAHGRWPRWVPRSSAKHFSGVINAIAGDGLCCFVGSPITISFCQPFCISGIDEWFRQARTLLASAKLPRSSSWPTPCGPSCWPGPLPRACAAGAPAIVVPKARWSCSPASPGE